jgi:4-hydroxybenzoate polyprenyltransferase
VFPKNRSCLKDWVKAARVHHWTKNGLVFLPFILGHGWTDPASLLTVLYGFVALLMVVSSTYMINDLADLASDRAHWSKCHRPIASGRIRILTALVVAITGILLGLGVGVFVSIPFEIGLFSYLVVTLAYSFGLKRVPLLDTFAIGFLFTLRLVMGTALAGQSYSEWLLAFSMLFFFSLATAKRQTELLRSISKGGTGARGYRAEDIGLVGNFGICAGMSSIVIMCLYLTSDAVQRVAYSRPAFLWAAPVIVSIWLGRIWLLASRGEMRDDPVSFAIRDRFSIGLGLVAVLAFILAL